MGDIHTRGVLMDQPCPADGVTNSLGWEELVMLQRRELFELGLEG